MVRRVTSDWLAAGEHPAMELVFEHMGITWPIEEREKLLRTVSLATFPSSQRSQVWAGYDQSRSTVRNVFYYPITASLRDLPSVWFRNLRLLQVRKRLNLVTSMRVNLTEPSVLAGEVLAKTQALEAVVGRPMMHRASVPPMRRPHMRTLMSCVRATVIRNAGLQAQQNRNHP